MTDWLWIPRSRPSASVRVYCFPSAGAGAGAFARWALLAPAHLEIVGIQLPGRETRINEPPLRTLSAAVEALAPIIQAADRRPFVFFGHSAGARLALHLAGALLPASPLRIFVSGASPVKSGTAPIHELDAPEFVARLTEQYGELPRQLTENPAVWATFERILRADFEALETDRFEPHALPVLLTVVNGSGDTVVTDTCRPLWQSWSKYPVDHAVLDADHFSYRVSPEPYLKLLEQYFPTREFGNSSAIQFC